MHTSLNDHYPHIVCSRWLYMVELQPRYLTCSNVWCVGVHCGSTSKSFVLVHIGRQLGSVQCVINQRHLQSLSLTGQLLLYDDHSVLISCLLHRLFQEILESTSSTDIEFYQNGTWEPIMEVEGMITLHHPHIGYNISYGNNEIIVFVYLLADSKKSEKLVLDRSTPQTDGVVMSKKSGIFGCWCVCMCVTCLVGVEVIDLTLDSDDSEDEATTSSIDKTFSSDRCVFHVCVCVCVCACVRACVVLVRACMYARE